MILRTTSVLVAAVLFVSCHRLGVLQLQEGDIVFQTSKSAQSLAIRLATHSRFSHMGIIRRDGAEVSVLEAVQPVKLTPLEDWIKRGEGRHVVAMRLKSAEGLLTPEAVERLRAAEDGYLGKRYDHYFEWSDDRIYCSELVWKAYNKALGIQLGELQRGSEFDFSSPVVQEKARERFPNGFPADELVISPDAIFRCDKLRIVYEQ